VLAPELQSHFHLSLEGVGVVLASVNLGVLATVLPWGILADRVGERAVIAAGLGSASVAVVAAAFANDVVALSLALFAAGALGASVQSASGRAVMGWFPPSQRGLALGIRQTGVPLGGAIAALVLPVCLNVSGLRAALAVLAGALLVAAAAGALWLRDPERPPAPGGSERPPLADPRIWRLCWASGLLYVALASLIGFAVLFLHSDRGVSTQVAAAMLALVQVIGAALRLLAGRWSDRVGTRLGPLRRLGLALAPCWSRRRWSCSSRRSSSPAACRRAGTASPSPPPPSWRATPARALRSASNRRRSRSRRS
jgi:sugar phosphate permease